MVEYDSRSLSAVSPLHRSRTYALLARAFRYPGPQFGAEVGAGQFFADLSAAAAGLPYSLSLAGDLTVAAGAPLAQTYTEQFDVGRPGEPPAHLYEGEYGGGRIGVMEDCLRFYHFFGLGMSQSSWERPDSLTVQLEFLHWLGFQEAGQLDQGRADLAAPYHYATRDFLRLHAGPLTESVAAATAQRAAPFYSALAQVAAGYCQRDLAYLSGAVEPGASQQQPGPTPVFPLLLQALEAREAPFDPARGYALRDVRNYRIRYDRITKATHITNCWYQRSCNFNLFVADGVVLREEQAGSYPAPNDPSVPDANPRGCQKGACYAHRMYDPTRIKYPLKRIGERGSGRWQRISWEQALTEIADQVIDVLTTDGPDTIIQGGGTRVHNFGSEGMGTNSLFESLGVPLPIQNTEIGDDHQGAAVTFGKVVFADSPDNWFHADVILVWGGNPAYTNIPSYHYIAEARYRGARVVVIAPDYNASAVHADLWVPVNVGTDAALALGMAHVMVREGLFKADFVREQTDLPLLVRSDTGRLLREKDLKRSGRDDVFYVFDEATQQVVEAPRASLALAGVRPALEGEYQVSTPQGAVRVRPVFALLKEKLERDYSPEQVSAITGTAPRLIEQLARQVAAAGGVVNISQSNFSKFYHGDLMERAVILVFALAGQIGRKGTGYSSFPLLTPDTGLGAWERQGHQMLQTAAGSDPRYAAWKADGWTTEMILNEYAKDAVAAGAMASTYMVHLFHGGLLDLHAQHQSWDPDLKRPLRQYVDEAMSKSWQPVFPGPEKSPRVLFQWGGNLFRRSRAARRLMDALLPKLKLIVTVDWRMASTGLYSDYVLPVCSWYERTTTNLLGSTQSPFFQVNEKAVDPLYESLSEWTLVVRFAEMVRERARVRGIPTFLDRNGKERRFDRVVEAVTVGGLYGEDDEESVARDAFMNAGNREEIEWEEFKERGIAAYTSLGSGVKALGNACDMTVGEPIVPLSWHTEQKLPYPTLTRRMQFYIDHDWYLELGEELPTHKAAPKAGGEYPLTITGGHARWSIHSDWVDDALLLGLQRGEPAMYVSVQDAADRAVSDGDRIEVFNDVGRFETRVIVSPTVRPGQAIMYHAWENYQFKDWGHFKDVMPSPLNPIELASGYGHLRPDALTFSPGPNDRGTRVDVRKVS